MMRSQVKNAFLLTVQAGLPLLNGVFSLKRSLFGDDRVVIIMYHKISHLSEGLDAEWNVSPRLFEEHMEILANGFSVIALEDFYQCLVSQRQPPPRSVVITFDDGYASVFQHAFPVLRRYGFPATIFQSVQFTEEQRLFQWDEQTFGDRPELFEHLRGLSWEEIGLMCASGLITMGSHTMSHPHLGRLSPEEIRYEVGESKRLLEQHTGREVTFFAFPGGIKRYGDISDTAIDLLIESGYKLACTSAVGRNTIQENHYNIKRIGIGRRDTAPLFRAKLSGAYDWVRFAQGAFQRVFGTVY